jgi:hypothetical protein
MGVAPRPSVLLCDHFHSQPVGIDRRRGWDDQLLACDEPFASPKSCEGVEEIVVAVLTARQAWLRGGVCGSIQWLHQCFAFGPPGG